MSNILHPLVYKDETIELYLENHQAYGLIIHCYSLKWGKKTYDHYLNIWVEFLDFISDNGYDCVYAMSDNSKLHKFASMFGFEATGEFLTDSEGNTKEVLKCPSK